MSDATADTPTRGRKCRQPDCGHFNPDDAQYCAKCGQSVAGIIAEILPPGEHPAEIGDGQRPCSNPECAHANPDSASYCAQCGHALEPETVQKDGEAEETKQHPLKEITQPFIDLMHAPRALWGINLAYVIEGMVYFGMLGYLAMFFNDLVGLDDVWAGRMVGVLTAGITIAMFLLGGVADKWGVRFAILIAFCFMLVGRVCMSLGPTIGLQADGMGSPIHLLTMGGILLVVIGYGMYQPGAYAAVRQFTTPKTAAMGFAMLYALMNLGGWLPSWFGFIRQRVGIDGAYWVYTAATAIALVVTFLILSKQTVRRAIAQAKAARGETGKEKVGADGRISGDLECVGCGYNLRTLDSSGVCPECNELVRKSLSLGKEAPPKEPFNLFKWFANHPLANPKFAFFIFCLIPVQTLFAHNWLTLPMYVERAFRGSIIGNYFEFAVNLNPLLIFIFVPIVTALTMKKNVYNMMILGTFVMAVPTFLLALGANPWTLGGYLLIMTIGEAMWQPRFLQYAAEIAPEGRTGAYMGVAQFPWFLTKVIVPLYSGWFLQRYCPDEGAMSTETMWFIYACIAMTSTVILILARGWVGKDFKTKAD
ncbi:MAG: MFS transporter [Phycisphaerae bacterium]|nr:MFS transporter [Phycisphaerae bacterium]